MAKTGKATPRISRRDDNANSSATRSGATRGPRSSSYPKIASNMRYVGPALIAATALAMLWWSWRAWPDVLVDFGRELYVPWRLAEGDVLYTEVAHFLGPFSPYLNSIWFRLFGTSLLTLAVCNIAIWIVILLVVYRLLRLFCDRFATTAACLVFVLLFSFGQYVQIGNYNYVCPYTSEAVHGLALCLISVLCLTLYLRNGKRLALALGGVFLGLSLLTRPEPPVACAAAHVVVLVGAALTGRRSTRETVWDFAIVGVAALVPLICAFVAMSCAMPVSQALRGTFAALYSTVASDVTTLKFFKSGMGLDDPARQTAKTLVWCGAYAAFTTVFLIAARLGRRQSPAVRWSVMLLLSLVGVTIIVERLSPAQLPNVFRPLLMAVLIFGGVAAWHLFRKPRSNDGDDAMRLALPLIVFAAAMQGKMLLNQRIFHYGFTLAMPGTLLLVVSLTGWIPQALTKRGAFGAGFRVAACLMLGVIVIVHLRIVRNSFAAKTAIVGMGADAFRADARGALVNEALAEIERRVGTDKTLAVMPDAAMINFLARRRNPTPYSTYGPTEVSIYGEDIILASLESQPPDFILLVHKDTSEYGFRFFGTDYAAKIGKWIATHYKSVKPFGAPPFQDQRFGMLLLAHTDGSGAGS